ncbi:SMR family transporter [Desulfitobacterium sp.]|uniref:SMR family transporter n=1 Tax=Desulfitobacterium sp. TaxID=49981 RepID=UPI002B84542F|nr:SMR family transporter [Desulfitobacterium sp.]HVJ49801.1 SMR family transporter [Desulfitobacterium sp.]
MLGLALVSVLLGAIGQILVKLGAIHLELDFSSTHLFGSLFSILKNLPVMSGLFFYGISFLLWVKVLTKLELSYAYPLVSIGYVLIMLVSWLVFKESISIYRILGTLFIIFGVILVARS